MGYEVTDSRIEYDAAMLTVRVDTVIMADGSTQALEVVEHADSAAIVAVGDHSQVLVVEQYRHAVGWNQIRPALKLIHTVVNATGARAAFHELTERGPRYPAVVRLWDIAWQEFIPFRRCS